MQFELGLSCEQSLREVLDTWNRLMPEHPQDTLQDALELSIFGYLNELRRREQMADEWRRRELERLI